MDSHLLAGALAIAVGVNVAIQSRINGELGDILGDGAYAALISFGTGLLCGLVALVFSRHARRGLALGWSALAKPSWMRASLPRSIEGKDALTQQRGAGELRWFQLLGGLSGAMFVASQSVTVASLGVALFTVCIVAGQTSNSLLVDRLGLAPGGVRLVTLPRVLAALLAIVAVVIGVRDRLDVEDFRLVFVVFVVVAGAAAAFQQAFNAQVARVSESVVVSSVVNFVVGFVALGLVVAGAHLLSGEALPPVPNPVSGDWWLYLGGPMGFAYTLGLALVVRTLGVLVFGLCAIAGQLAGAVAMDIVAPAPGAAVTWQVVTAVVLTFAAVLLAGVAGRRATG